MKRLEFIVRRRSQKRFNEPKKTEHKFNALVMVVLTLISLGLISGIFIGALLYSQVSQNLPAILVLENLLDYPDGLLYEPTRFYDRTGQIVIHTLQNPDLGQIDYHHIEERKSTTLPDHLLDAVLASVDPRYWDHGGVDMLSLNSSTSIAERMVMELIMWNQPENLLNTWKTRLLALQVIDTYGHDQVLEWYLNTADMGNYLIGVEAAAWIYLGKSATEVNLAEAALLAAIIDAPALNPIDAPLASLDRQQIILKKMVQYNFISEKQAVSANNTPIHIVHNVLKMDPFVDLFVEQAIHQIQSEIPVSRLARGGYKVITTLDYQAQTDTHCMTVIHLTRLELQQPEYSVIEDCPTSGLLPRLSEDDIPGQSDLASEIVVYDPNSAEVLAYVGLNPDGRIPQPGTIISPFLYLTAFTRGMNPATMVWDLPQENLGGVPEDFLGPVSARTALANDLLTPIFDLYSQVGFDNAMKTYQTVGISNLEITRQKEQQMQLEDGSINLIQVAQGYGTISNQGILTGIELPKSDSGNNQDLSAVFVLEVLEYDNRQVYALPQKVIRPVTTSQLAYLITDVLSDVYARQSSSTRTDYLEIGRPAAVKTGRTSNGTDVWTIGYTPELVTVVWIGEKNLEKEITLSPVLTSSLWRAVTQNVHNALLYSTFEQPENISIVEVCTPSGGLPTNYCPSVIKEKFLAGQEPNHFDSLFRPIQINSQTGKLATLFTPADQITEEIFMVLPPDALEWAIATGVKVPPEDYDIVLSSAIKSSRSMISTPLMFAYVSGEVEIFGTAEIPDLDYFRLQVGQGLNPREWFQIGEAVSDEVSEDTLAVWDTTGFNGLYAIQLLVISQDNRVESATVQVTVDNIPPELIIYYPQSGQEFSYPEEREITFQADVLDNVGIDRVEFIVDGLVVFQMEQGPFLYPWEGTLGEHEVTVRVIDLAGNVVEQSIEFLISQ